MKSRNLSNKRTMAQLTYKYYYRHGDTEEEHQKATHQTV